eukprot:GEMP01055615.1.p1 GENE.GEMP01055615.1~~GEMP01055615.1.p1  ORF type:complete len:234 (-),score=43.99 GEMP01055615.1:809-1510(-)
MLMSDSNLGLQNQIVDETQFLQFGDFTRSEDNLYVMLKGSIHGMELTDSQKEDIVAIVTKRLNALLIAEGKKPDQLVFVKNDPIADDSFTTFVRALLDAFPQCGLLAFSYSAPSVLSPLVRTSLTARIAGRQQIVLIDDAIPKFKKWLHLSLITHTACTPRHWICFAGGKTIVDEIVAETDAARLPSVIFLVPTLFKNDALNPYGMADPDGNHCVEASVFEKLPIPPSFAAEC